MSIKILIGGDFVPSQSNYKLFEKGEVDTLVGKDIVNILEQADMTIFNLEVPLTNEEKPISKCGPCLIAPTKAIAGLKIVKNLFLNLANNHILDQDVQGLYSTISILNQEGVDYAGAGRNIDEAKKPFIKKIGKKKIGIYSCTEHEFSIANETNPGANPFDTLESLDHIASLKNMCDYVIVLYHGGKEHYQYPSPYLQKVCRKMVEKGADMVVCQHSHCVGCKEEWLNGVIVYGQGNFLFDRSQNELWNSGLLIQIDIGEVVDIRYIPICKSDNTVRLSEEDRKNEIMDGFLKRSQEILEADKVSALYKQLALDMKYYYLRTFLGDISDKLWFRIINKLTVYRFEKFYIQKRFTRKTIVSMQNYIECEAHRELLLESLKRL